jgi:segregation and condensation protein B
MSAMHGDTAGESVDPISSQSMDVTHAGTTEDSSDPTPVARAGGVESVAGTESAPAVADVSGGPASASQLRGAIEAILLVIDEPVDQILLAQVLDVPEPHVVACLEDVRREYDAEGRGFELREVAGGWRLYTRAEFASFVERFLLDGQQARLTQAALETLAVVAYRQPVSRTRVSAVRGVNVDGVMRTLASRGLVEEAGFDDESGAVLYRTSRYFLERFGLKDLTELPKLANFLPESTTIDELESQLSGEG